jgi:hypothetical protein
MKNHCIPPPPPLENQTKLHLSYFLIVILPPRAATWGLPNILIAKTYPDTNIASLWIILGKWTLASTICDQIGQLRTWNACSEIDNFQNKIGQNQPLLQATNTTLYNTSQDARSKDDARWQWGQWGRTTT